MIDPEDIEAVRAQTDIVEIVSEYVRLSKSGRQFRGLCPFHPEKTPSFYVDPAKQLYHCFGCGEGGNVFTFLTQMEKAEFSDIVEQLADRINYQLRRTKKTHREKRGRDRLYAACDAAARLYQWQLKETTEGKAALDYLTGRGIGSSAIDRFSLGFATSKWDTMTKNLLKKGYTNDDLVNAGLSVPGHQGLRDRFRSRIMFPIRDIRGRVVGFGGRVFGEGEPKYVNSPETPIYHKGSLLYNLDAAKRPIMVSDEAIVVEGYTDVIALVEKGIENVVASLGTAFTIEQLRTVARFTKDVVLAFDADSAGKNAAERGIELLKEAKVSIRIARLPVEQDPADLVASEGIEAMETKLAEAVPLPDFCIDQALGRHDVRDPVERSRAADEALDIVLALPDPVIREEYLRRLADRLQTSDAALRLKADERLRYTSKVIHNSDRSSTSRHVARTAEERAQFERELMFLRMAIRLGQDASPLIERAEPDLFVESNHRQVVVHVRRALEEGSDVIAAADPADEQLQRVLSGLTIADDVEHEDVDDAAEGVLLELQRAALKREIQRLKAALVKTDPTSDRSEYERLFARIVLLERERRGIRQTSDGGANRKPPE